MSWRVRSLLINRDAIKRNVNRVELIKGYYDEELEDFSFRMIFFDVLTGEEIDIEDIEMPAQIFDVDDEDYSDLLDVERVLKSLYHSNKFSIRDIDIINLILYGYTYREIGELLEIDKMFVQRAFVRICNMIEKELGFDFTDFGFATGIAKRFNLTSEQIKNLLKFMEST